MSLDVETDLWLAKKSLTVSDVIRMAPDSVLVGLVMKLTGGTANPVVVQRIIDRIRGGAGDE